MTRAIPKCMQICEHPIRAAVPAGMASMFAAVAAVSPEGLGDSESAQLGLQVWRLARRVEELGQGDVERTKRQFGDSLRRFQQLLSDLRIEVTDPIGEPYTDGWIEVDVIAWEDGKPPPGIAGPWVKQTLKPILRRDGRLLTRGEIVVGEPAGESDVITSELSEKKP